MRTSVHVRHSKPRSTRPKNDSQVILFVPKQSREKIRALQAIREAIHDSRAHTIKGGHG
jgi:hypothetical protein